MSKIDDFINQNDELNIQSILEKYENKQNAKVLQNDEIWSEPLEDPFSVNNDIYNKNNNIKAVNLDLNSDLEDTPSTFLKNNQTIRLSGYDAPKKMNLWDQDELISKWDKFNNNLNSNENDLNSNDNNLNNLLTSQFQPESLQTKKYESEESEQLNLESMVSNDKVDFNIPGFAEQLNLESVVSNDKVHSNVPNLNETQLEDLKSDVKSNISENYVEQYSTKILFDDNSNNVPKTELTKEINDAENITIKPKKQISDKKITKMKAKQLYNEQYKKVPKFFRFEFRTAQICLWITTTLLIAALGLLTSIVIISTMGITDYWLLLPVSVGVLIFIFLFTKSVLDYNYLKKDLKNSNFQIDNSVPMTSIRKMYKKLLGANISLNWISAAAYVVSGLGVLLTYIVTYFMNLTALEFNDFTRLIIGHNNYLPVIFVWVFVGISCLTFVIQIVFNILNRRRRNEIELFYKNSIFDDATVSKTKKNANIKGAIIFSFSIFVVGFIVLMIYFILRRRKLTKI